MFLPLLFAVPDAPRMTRAREEPRHILGFPRGIYLPNRALFDTLEPLTAYEKD